MDKILLVHPPFGSGNHKRPPDIFDPHFPWGLGYISGVLKKEGYDFEVFDIYVHQWCKAEVVEKLNRLEYSCVCITAKATQYSYVKWLAHELKKRNVNCTIVLGGPLATYSYEVVLENCSVDICVIGPGEETIVDLMENSNNLKTVKGIAFKDSEGIFVTDMRNSAKSLDEIPSPVFDLFRMDIYTTNKLYIHNKSMTLYTHDNIFPVMAMVTGRGCPLKCNFCSPSFRTFKIMSVESILGEVDFFVERYGVKGINFVDELLFLKKDMIAHMAEELGRRGILWNGQARIDTVDINRLEFYKKNGLVSIGYGIESGSEFLLKEMNKKITREKMETVLKKTLEVGLHIKVQLVFGYPGENYDTVNETIELFKKIGHPGRRFSILTPLPGSQIYELAKRRGFITNEDEYLSRIYEGFWRTTINMTEFTDEEFERVRKESEIQMKENYKEYLATMKKDEREKRMLLCNDDFEKDFLNQISSSK